MADLLATGSNALIAFQRALSTVSHNVANVNTDGYSRQRAEFSAASPTLLGNSYQGNGVRLGDIRRMADELATARLLDSGGELSRLQQLSTLSNRVDALLSDRATGLTSSWSSFFDAVGALSSNAAGAAERADVLARAQALTTRFKQIDAQLDGMAGEVNAGLRAGADEINRLTREIATLNATIGSNVSRASADMLDQRDRLIAQLLGYTGGSAVTQDNGQLNVYTAGGQALVTGASAAQVATVTDPYRPEQTRLALSSNGQTTLLESRMLGGKLGGLLEFRERVLQPALAELGRIAVGLADGFNRAHAAGMDQYGQLGGDFFTVSAPRVTAYTGNGGSAELQASLGDLAALNGRDLLLRYDGVGWSATYPDTGATVPVSGSGTPADPLRVNGVELVLGGGPLLTGDRFLLQPTAGAAGTLTVAIADPARIAAAGPVRVSADLANVGSGVVSALSVDDPSHVDLTQQAELLFVDANTYLLDGVPHAYVPGQAITYHGWRLVLDGAPAAGDRFTVQATGAGSSDNANALRLANLDDSQLLASGTASLNGAIAGLTTTVGSHARQAEYATAAQQVIHDQALAARDSIAGVNLDEEAADLLRLQQTYQAAAQIISTADTLFQTLLSAVRR